MPPKNDTAVVSDEEDIHSLDGYYSDEPLKPEPKYPPLNESFENAIIITNIPKVVEAKVERLTKVLMKIFVRIGTLATDEDSDYQGLFMPFDADTGLTRGFAFVEFDTAAEARKAVEVLTDYKFDKNHVLHVTPYERGAVLQRVPTDFTEPAPAPFVEKPNTYTWLEDPNQRDQFVIREGHETVVYWHDAKSPEPVVDYDGRREKEAGTNWCEYYVHWSPKGSFLATLVPAKGVILWGGQDYAKLGRLPSAGVEFVLFSPQENYILTSNNNKNDPNAIKIFSIQTAKLLRAFPLYPNDFVDAHSAPPPPFQWSHDDKYLARMGKDMVSIYETPSMKLLERRSLGTPGIHEFQWSPKANVIAYWAPEVANSPAHVDLIAIPSREKLRQKNLFNVSKCSMVWQSAGDYLSVKVTRHTKSKKTLYNNMELFRINEPGIPVEMLDIKDAVMAFAWEPKGSRFAMIHAENPTSTKVNVSFYDMMKKVDVTTTSSAISKKPKKTVTSTTVPELNKCTTLLNKQCNCLFWSPVGRLIVLAGLGDAASGTLEFYDAVADQTLASKDHYRANAVLWDPSGRMVATTVSQPIEGGHFKFAMDNGYILWSFQGRQLTNKSFENFYQFVWRPREELLTPKECEDVVKNLKKYERVFEKEDRERIRSLHMEETKEKRALRKEYRERLSRLNQIRKEQKRERMELLGGYDSEDESNFVTKQATLEMILSTKEEVAF